MEAPKKELAETNYGTKTASGNPRIFNCEKCKRAFTREEHLARHILSTHNKLKPFTCGICSRPFSRRDLLLRHAKNLHGGSEHAVSRIRKSFKRSGSESGISTNATIASSRVPHVLAIPTSRPTRSLSTSSTLSTSGSISNLIHSEVPTEMVYTGYNNVHFGSHESNESNILQRNSPRINTTSGSGESEMNMPSLNSSYETPEKKRMKISVNMLVS